MVAYTQTVVSPTAVDGSARVTTETATETTVSTSLTGLGSAAVDTDRWTETALSTSLTGLGSAVVDTDLFTTTGIVPNVWPDNVRIPTGEFRYVKLYLEDQKGRPLEGAEWVQSGGLFPTAGKVEKAPNGDMVAGVWLLPADYETFIVLGDSERPGLDYVWYELSDANPDPAVPRTDREATLKFNKQRVAGLWAGNGTDFGGMLG